MPSVRQATSIRGRAHVRRQTRGRVRADDSRLEPAFRAPSAGGPCRQAPRISWHRPARATNRQAPREHAAPSGPAIDSTAATPAYPTPPTISATQTKGPEMAGARRSRPRRPGSLGMEAFLASSPGRLGKSLITGTSDATL